MTARKATFTLFIVVASLLVAACGSSKRSVYKASAEASYYADKFDGRKTANGETFRNQKLTAAHRTLPFGTKLRVTNLANGKSVVVTVNDRGPQKKSRELDLSKRAFMEITDNKNHGTLRVSIEVL